MMILFIRGDGCRVHSVSVSVTVDSSSNLIRMSFTFVD